MKFTRRKFIYIGFLSIFVAIFKSSQDVNEILIYDDQLKNYIINFNKKRNYDLQNNFKNLIKDDLNKERTIWIKNKLYTYAEIYNLNIE